MSDALQPTPCPFCNAASSWISTTVEKWACGTIVDHARSGDDVLMRADQTYTCRKAELAKLQERIKRLEEAGDIIATWAPRDRVGIWIKAKEAKP